MKKIVQVIFFLMPLFILSCDEKLEKEIVFFEGIDFDSGEYKLLVNGSEGKQFEDYYDFYIDDIQTLNEMKKQWVFTRKSEITACGYGYNVKLVNQNGVVKSTSINIECEYMSGWIRFPKRYLTDHKKSFKKMTVKREGL
jgi:hypothetical protein